jgi:hypothetical protein
MARKKKLEEESESKYDVMVGFVHEFRFLTDIDSTRLNGHPAPGRVYRILKDPQGYRIHIGRENNKEGLDGLYLGETLNGEYGRYAFNIEIITPTNYLTLPIFEDDRKQVLEWVQSENNDLWENLRKEEAGESAVIRTGQDLLKVLMTNGLASGGKLIGQTSDSTKVGQVVRERALEASLTLITHFKNKNIDDLLKLFDEMHFRIESILEGDNE